MKIINFRLSALLLALIMLLTVLVSAIVFKERFDKMRIAGTVMGLLGILLLSIPV